MFCDCYPHEISLCITAAPGYFYFAFYLFFLSEFSEMLCAELFLRNNSAAQFLSLAFSGMKPALKRTYLNIFRICGYRIQRESVAVHVIISSCKNSPLRKLKLPMDVFKLLNQYSNMHD